MNNVNTTEVKGYILKRVTLNKNLQLKNRKVTKLLAAANERILTMPNPIIMFNQIILMESKGSSEIENIITTNDELWKEVINASPRNNNASKTLRIKSAVKHAAKLIDQNKSILPKDILALGETINGNNSGFRPTLGTKLINDRTKEVINTPPQDKKEVQNHINILLTYFNQGGENDPITDSLLLHHAFEWIHPFSDGNGRTGRVLIGAYLKLQEEVDHIFLPISYFINKGRDKYYKALEEMTNLQDYELYLDTMFDFMIEASKFTIKFARDFEKNKQEVRNILWDKFGKYHEKKLIDCLFFNAYTTPNILVQHTELNYRTITKIIDFLISKDIFIKKKEGRNTFYINKLIVKGVSNE